MPTTISFCGRPVSQAELGLIRDLIRDFPALSLAELSKTICELLEWRRPSGGLKNHECRFFLQQLKDRGWISSLPELRGPSCRGPGKINLDASSEPEALVDRSLDDWGADYRVFSRSPWDPQLLFDPVIDHAIPLLPPFPAPIIGALASISTVLEMTNEPRQAAQRRRLGAHWSLNKR